jgi:DEAD/DEAH box helicase domain-containing protein
MSEPTSRDDVCIYVQLLMYLTEPRLLLATPPKDDAVALLRAAAHDHIPVNPAVHVAVPFENVSLKDRLVPESKDRPSIEDVIAEAQKEAWYTDQIVERRTFEARTGRIGNAFRLQTFQSMY